MDLMMGVNHTQRAMKLVPVWQGDGYFQVIGNYRYNPIGGEVVDWYNSLIEVLHIDGNTILANCEEWWNAFLMIQKMCMPVGIDL
jgi:hypothetical protein